MLIKKIAWPGFNLTILNKHLHWIEGEWKNITSDFKLFAISSGILKTTVNK